MKRLIQTLRKIRDRFRAYYMLKQAVHGMTLNTIGPIYGVERRPGESNGHYESRILLEALWYDRTYIKKVTSDEE